MDAHVPTCEHAGEVRARLLIAAAVVGVALRLRTKRGRWPVGARPLRAALAALLRSAPSVRAQAQKRFWSVVYDAANRGRTSPETAFMNYGYAPIDGATEGVSADPASDPDRFGLQLYAKVAGAVELSGKDVLEVGCGRGGGAVYVFDRLRPRSMTGIDLSTKAIARCQAEYQRPGLAFRAADAEDLPFADGSFDVLLNVESSHCYPDVPRFLAEAHRVLRPGGVLLLADVRHTVVPEAAKDALMAQEDVAQLRDQIRASGFRTVEEEDITPNVLRALQLDSAARRARVERRVARPLRRQALEFAAVEGSALFRAYAAGQLTYLRFVLQKL
jgi:SAM-dependent methyltransferase